MLRHISNRSLTIPFRRLYSSIPFDSEPFPFSRFEPCCPDDKVYPNGFVPCKKHPMPNILGSKIDLEVDMTRHDLRHHIVACVGNGPEWLRSKVEAVPEGIVHAIEQMEKESIAQRTSATVSGGRDTLVTICDRPTKYTWPTCDVFVFPDFKYYTGINPKSLPTTDLGNALSSIYNRSSIKSPDFDNAQDISADTIILVCTHEWRDKRCGRIGPQIVEEFRQVLKSQNMNNVEVWGTSHFGGHKFAGNVIIYQRGWDGHMYGNVRPCHVNHLIDRHILHGKVVKELWRGRVTTNKDAPQE